jgi:DNA-directed RNA polymerase subunit N (RpoN/RPB10)
MSFAYLCSTACTCGRIVGDRFVQYVELVERGMSNKDALNHLGLNRICCRTTVISATPYIMRKGNTGTVSIENPVSAKAEVEKTPSKRGLSLSTPKRSVSISNSAKLTRPEPRQEYDYKYLRRGEVAVIGYERDDDGNLVMVDVGDEPGHYFVPRLQLIHGVAQQNLG